jgi:hypothetical protein
MSISSPSIHTKTPNRQVDSEPQASAHLAVDQTERCRGVRGRHLRVARSRQAAYSRRAAARLRSAQHEHQS